MKEVRYNGNKIIRYDSIENLPMKNYEKIQQFLIMEAQIGSNVNAIDGHIASMFRFIKAKKHDELQNELVNFRQNLIFMIEGVNPGHLAFVPGCYSINGKRVVDISDDACQKWKDYLSDRGFTRDKILVMVDDLKKKLTWSLIFGLKTKFRRLAKKRTFRYTKNTR